MWTVFCSDTDRSAALKLARGSYQKGLLLGHEAWSGSTPGSYGRSRDALLARLRKAGLEVAFETVNRKKVLVVGSNRPSDWERLIDEAGEDALRQAAPSPYVAKVYLDEGHPDAFVDFPAKAERPAHLPGAVECPRCKGHGGWNLELNCYPLHGHESTPENRHRYAHFRASCAQCQGHGWTNDVACIHDFHPAGSVAMFQHVHRCQKCGVEQVWDSSG
jgi:hypothetical protein